MKVSNENIVSRLNGLLDENDSWHEELFAMHNQFSGGYNSNYVMNSITVMVEGGLVQVLADIRNEYVDCSGDADEESSETFPGGDQVRLELGGVDEVLNAVNQGLDIEMKYDGDTWATVSFKG